MSRAEEIAKRCAADICNLALAKSPSTHILAALHEYGQAVRDRDAEIAEKSTAYVQFQSQDCYKLASYLNAEISKEALP